MPRTWTLTHDHVAMVWFPGVQLVQKTDQDTGDPGWRFAHVAFRVSDTEAAVRELEGRGLKFLPHEPGKPYFFEDPDGVIIELLV